MRSSRRILLKDNIKHCNVVKIIQCVTEEAKMSHKCFSSRPLSLILTRMLSLEELRRRCQCDATATGFIVVRPPIANAHIPALKMFAPLGILRTAPCVEAFGQAGQDHYVGPFPK